MIYTFSVNFIHEAGTERSLLMWYGKDAVKKISNEYGTIFSVDIGKNAVVDIRGTYINYGYLVDTITGELLTRDVDIALYNNDYCLYDNILELVKAGEAFQCVECGNYFNYSDIGYLLDGSHYCETCFSDNYTICEDCGEVVPITESYITYCDHVFCEDCISAHAFFCEYHERYEEFRYEREYVTREGVSYCYEGLQMEGLEVCGDCGEVVSADEGNYCNGSFYCEDCRPARFTIRSYHDYPDDYGIRHLSNHFTTLYMGVELETDEGGCRDDYAEKIIERFKMQDAYSLLPMEDSSLSDGIEFISQPYNLQEHEQAGWQDVMQKAVELGYSSHTAGTCGLHIHVNKTYFDSTSYYKQKLSLLTYKLTKELQIFSRRKEFIYCKFKAQGDWIDAGISMAIKEKKFNVLLHYLTDYVDDNQSHYSAINFRGTDTVEFRFNRGTLKYNTFIASLQLVQILCDFARNEPLETLIAIDWKDIKQEAEKRFYHEFLIYCNERNL